MISVYRLKPAFQNLLKPLLTGLRKSGLTPNHISVVAIFLSGLVGYFLWKSPENNWFLLLVPVGLLLRMALNAIDGMMAVQFNMKSKLGEVLNEFGDIISDILILLPTAFLPGMNIYFVIAITLLAVLNECAGILAKAVNGIRRYDGPMGKSDRALVIGLLCITYFIYPGIAEYVHYIIWVVSLLMIYSTTIRLSKAVK